MKDFFFKKKVVTKEKQDAAICFNNLNIWRFLKQGQKYTYLCGIEDLFWNMLLYMQDLNKKVFVSKGPIDW